MAFLKRKDVNMLEGALIPKIIAFAVPLMLSNLLQVLYSAADMIIVAQSGVAGAVGAIGTTTQVINLVVNSFIGFSIGANVLVARLIGAREDGRIPDAVHTAITAGLLFGLAGAVVGFFAAPTAMTLMGDEGAVWEMAVKYCRIRFVGLPLLALTNFSIAIFRAKGDSTTPLTVLSLSGALNVALNLLFVRVFHMDVDGVAWATVAASFFSAAQLLFFLAKERGPCHVSVSALRIRWSELKEILSIGIPAALQSVLYSLSNTIITSSVISVNNRVCPGGSFVVDGHAAAGSIESFMTTCGEALTLSYVSFTSQHVGAKKFKRLRTFIADAYLCAVVFTLAFCALILLFRDPLLSLYISEPGAFETAHTRMWILVTTYFLWVCMCAGGQILRGLGRSTTAMLITLISTCLLRIVWIYTVFAKYQTLESIYVSYPISWIIASVAQFTGVALCYRSIVKKTGALPEK